MVRTIVGTLLEIEGHKLPTRHMQDVLDAKDRRKAGRKVSPYGLTLMRVDYSLEENNNKKEKENGK
jgi:tRNA pseudouridine38-40 synthase